MSKNYGYVSTYAVIKSVHFRMDKMRLILSDGRELILPLKKFSEIARLSPAQRKKHSLLAGKGIMFDDLDTVYHISDFLGLSERLYETAPEAKISKVAEAPSPYRKGKRRK